MKSGSTAARRSRNCTNYCSTSRIVLLLLSILLALIDISTGNNSGCRHGGLKGFVQDEQKGCRTQETDTRRCQEVSTVEPFDLKKFVSKPWYAHQQQRTFYLPESNNYCVSAAYRFRDQPTFPFGYTVDVFNYSENVDGTVADAQLCATVKRGESEKASKLSVALCFLPQVLSGDYWVVLYDEKDGYALISTGQPTRPSPDDSSGGCRGDGLWIFLRSSKRDSKTIDKVRKKAKEIGFDLSVLNDVEQGSFCSYPKFPPE